MNTTTSGSFFVEEIRTQKIIHFCCRCQQWQHRNRLDVNSLPNTTYPYPPDPFVPSSSFILPSLSRCLSTPTALWLNPSLLLCPSLFLQSPPRSFSFYPPLSLSVFLIFYLLISFSPTFLSFFHPYRTYTRGF